MRGFVWRPFVVVKDLPIWEISGQVSRPQAFVSRFFTWPGNVHDRDQRTARLDALLGWFKEIALQVVGKKHEIPGGRLDAVLASLKIRDSRVHADAAFQRAPAQPVDRNTGGIHGSDIPTMSGEP